MKVKRANFVGAAYDGGYFTPGEVLDEMRTIDAMVSNLDRDVSIASVPDNFKMQWAAFRDEWRSFFADNKNVISRAMNQTFAKTLEFRDRVEDWRKAFVVEGGKVTTPSLPTFNKARGGEFPWKTLIIGGGLLAAGAWWLGRDKRHEQ